MIRKLTPTLRLGELRRILTDRGKMKMTDEEVGKDKKRMTRTLDKNDDKDKNKTATKAKTITKTTMPSRTKSRSTSKATTFIVTDKTCKIY